jgi:hypothetical protein
MMPAPEGGRGVVDGGEHGIGHLDHPAALKAGRAEKYLQAGEPGSMGAALRPVRTEYFEQTNRVLWGA